MKFTSEMMIKVHELAKQFEGDYSARLALAFREIAKNEEVSYVDVEEIVEEICENEFDLYRIINKCDHESHVLTIEIGEKDRRGRKSFYKACKILIQNNKVLVYSDNKTRIFDQLKNIKISNERTYIREEEENNEDLNDIRNEMF
jgi:hypothetical protein